MRNTANKYDRYLKKFIGKKILVIGDLILDRYLQGSCSRIAPEATVPVIDLNSSRECLGGAANVAANLCALGANVQLCSVIGMDTYGQSLTNLLKEHGINTDLVIHDQGRSTICKTRVSSGPQLIVRYDEGSCDPVSNATLEQLKQHIIAGFDQVDAVFISDYGKGVLTNTLIDTLISLRQNSTQIIAVDARDFTFYADLEPTLIKPNYSEAVALCQFKAAHDKRAEQVKSWGKSLYQRSAAKHIFLSMDKDGVCCFKEGNFCLHRPAPTVANPQVSGAGDTFIATALMAFLSGADITATTELAVSAAAMVISAPHTAVCDISHLKKNLGEKQKLLLAKQEIKQLIADYKAQGKRIVFTNGCFDILHSGHVSYLKGSKAQGDVLIVGLNTDESIKRLKGLQRPINSLDDRTEVLSELSCIDHIIPFGEHGDDTPISLLKLIKPHFFVKGGDYRHKLLPEKKLLDSIGCKIVFLPTVANRSTSNVISKIQENLSFSGQNIVN